MSIMQKLQNIRKEIRRIYKQAACQHGLGFRLIDETFPTRVRITNNKMYIECTVCSAQTKHIPIEKAYNVHY